MPKFRLEYSDVHKVSYTIEADSLDDARRISEELLSDGDWGWTLINDMNYLIATNVPEYFVSDVAEVAEDTPVTISADVINELRED